jgi:DNA-binding GntR family transcriptional regulator
MTNESYIDRQSFSGQIYDVIKKDIYDQNLAPGEKFNIRQYANKLNCSIAPIREALSKLHAERLFEFKPYTGYVVTSLLDKESFINLFEARKLLELKSVELAAQNITEKELDSLRTLIQKGEVTFENKFDYENIKQYNDFNYKFHHFIFEIAGNNFLLQAWESLHAHLHLSRLYRLKGIVDSKGGPSGHWEIFNALENRDISTAVTAAEKHLSFAFNRLLPGYYKNSQEDV